MNILSKIIISLCFLCLFIQPAYAEDIFKCTFKPEKYPILTDENGNVTMQGKAKWCEYEKNAKMSALFKKIKGLPEKEKLKIPEYLVARKFLAIQKEDLPAIYEFFTGEEDLKRAKDLYGKNIKSISSFVKDYTDLNFFSKAYFGNHVWVGYDCIGRPGGRTFPAWCYVKLANGRYYVTRDIDDYEDGMHIFPLLSSCYSEDLAEKSDVTSSKDFMVNLTFYAKDNQGNDIKENPVSLSYNSVPYTPDHSIFLEKNRKDDEEAAFLYKVVKTFPKGNDEETLDLWHPDGRKDISDMLQTEREENVVTDIFQFRCYFKDIEDANIVDKIYSKDGVIVYYEPIIKGKVGPLQTIIFKRSKGVYFLAKHISKYYITQLLQSKYMLQSIKERLNQRRPALKKQDVIKPEEEKTTPPISKEPLISQPPQEPLTETDLKEGAAPEQQSTLHLKTGRVITGEIISEDSNSIKIKTGLIEFTIDRDDIDRVE